MKFNLMIKIMNGVRLYKTFSNRFQAQSYADHLNRINKADVAWVEKCNG